LETKTAYNKKFLQWCRDELVLNFYLRSTFGFVGQDAASKRHHCRNSNVASNFTGQVDTMKLTTDKVYSTMLTLFPSQNDFSQSDYEEELKELLDFGVDTVEKFRNLMTRHRERLLEIDSEPLDDQNLKWYREDNTIENLELKIEKGFWFAFPGLIRIGLELEFGKKYEIYADKRDGLIN
jgi:hypothetical protein